MFYCYFITVVSVFSALPSSAHPISCSYSQFPHHCLCPWVIDRFYSFAFREREREGGREKHHVQEKHQPVAFCIPPASDLVSNPGMYPQQELNWQPWGLQDNALPMDHTSQGYFAIVLDNANLSTSLATFLILVSLEKLMWHRYYLSLEVLIYLCFLR